MTFLDWVTSSAATTSVLAFAGFLARHWIIERLTTSIKYEYEKELATHKADLKRNYDVQLEKLKAELAQQHSRFSHVFEDTAATIVTNYQKLLALKDAYDNYTQMLEPASREENIKVLREKAADFFKFYQPNKIFIPKDTSAKIDKLYHALSSATMQFSMALTESKMPNREADSYGKLFNTFFETNDKIPSLLLLLEDDFQSILGFPIHNQTKNLVTNKGNEG